MKYIKLQLPACEDTLAFSLFSPCFLHFTNGTTLQRMHSVTTSFPATATQLFCGSFIILMSVEKLVIKEEWLCPIFVDLCF